MEIFLLNYPNQIVHNDLPAITIALGYFDGIHLGHQAVLNTAKEISKKNDTHFAVMIFEPHPSIVLQRDVKHVRLITPLTEKIRLLKEAGVAYLFIVDFTTQFSEISPQEFVDEYLIGLNVKHVVAGFDYTYGRYGAGKMETMPFHTRGKFDFTIVQPSLFREEKISSTRIRMALGEGDCQLLSSLLGRNYQIAGMVIHGEKRGAKLGFPTANLLPVEDYDLPATGVYAVKIKVKERWYEAVCNLGYKPTFHENLAEKPTIEVHIFDFQETIYGEHVVLEWHKRIRNEIKFDSVDSLVKRIELDKQYALTYFGLTQTRKN